MAETKTVNVETTNARASTTLTDTTPTVPLPDLPQGLMVVGPQVTLHFVEGEWNKANSYDYYDVVQVDGTSYIAVQDVPANTEITNTDYWAKWNDPNAQVELLQQTVGSFDQRITEADDVANAALNAAQLAESNTNNALDQIANAVNGYLGVTINSTTKNFDFLYSPNLEDFTLVKSITPSINGDFAYLKKIGDYYYIFTNDGYGVTSDFNTFNFYTWGITTPVSGAPIWGLCNVPDSNYMIICYRYLDASNTIVTDMGGTSYYFRPAIGTYSQAENGVLTFSNFTNIPAIPGFTVNTSSYIDVDVIKMNDVYYLAFKNEKTAGIEIYNASTIEAIANGNMTHLTAYIKFYGAEGPKLINTHGKLSLLVSEYNYSQQIRKFTSIPTANTFGGYNVPIFYHNILEVKNNATNYTFCKMDTPNRHMGIIEVDDTIRKNVNLKSCAQSITCYKDSNVVFSSGNVTYNGPIIPFILFNIAGSASITYNISDSYKEYADHPMYVMLSTNNASVNVKLGTGFNAPLSGKNINASNSSSVEGYKLYDGNIAAIYKQGSGVKAGFNI